MSTSPPSTDESRSTPEGPSRSKLDLVKALISRSWTGKVALAFVGVYLLQTAFSFAYGREAMIELFAFTPADLAIPTAFAAAIVSTFSHGNIIHFAVNTFVFISFALVVEQNLDAKRMFALFCLSGAAASVAQVAITPELGADVAPTLGASGGIGALLAASAFLEPDEELVIYVPIPITTTISKVAGAITVITIAVIVAFGPTAAGIAHISHLTGLLLGGVVGLWWAVRA